MVTLYPLVVGEKERIKREISFCLSAFFPFSDLTGWSSYPFSFPFLYLLFFLYPNTYFIYRSRVIILFCFMSTYKSITLQQNDIFICWKSRDVASYAMVAFAVVFLFLYFLRILIFPTFQHHRIVLFKKKICCSLPFPSLPI